MDRRKMIKINDERMHKGTIINPVNGINVKKFRCD